jgi:hypothetical protein
MPIVITCPNPSCGKRYAVPDDSVGRTATCASCGAKIPIVAGAAEVAKAPTPLPPTNAPPSEVEFEPRRRRQRDDDERDEHDDLPSVRRRPRGRAGGAGFADFALFRFLITPRILTLLYWFVVGIVILAGVALILGGLFGGGGPGQIIGRVAGGLFVMVVGPILYRILFESLIVVFRIYDTLNEIRDQTSHQP